MMNNVNSGYIQNNSTRLGDPRIMNRNKINSMTGNLINNINNSGISNNSPYFINNTGGISGN